LSRRVEDVANDLVIGPVEAELAAYERLCAATREAMAGPGRRGTLTRRRRNRVAGSV
jgi:hypothetical protein